MMHARSILRGGVAVRIRKAVPWAPPASSSWNEKCWNLACCRSSFTTTNTTSAHRDDPAAGLLDGSGQKKLSDLSTRELQAALDCRGRHHKDCLDRRSLEKRLADELLQQHNEERRAATMNKPRQQDLAGATEAVMAMSAPFDFVAYIPWLPFALSTDGDNNNNNKPIFVMIPPWEVDRVRADFERCGGVRDPSVAKRERQRLVDCLADICTPPYDPRDAAKVATAVLLLQLHDDDDNDGIIRELGRAVLLDETIPSRYSTCITCLPPVPKNWTLDDEIVMARPAELKERTERTIDLARHFAGETEAIPDLDKFRQR